MRGKDCRKKYFLNRHSNSSAKRHSIFGLKQFFLLASNDSALFTRGGYRPSDDAAKYVVFSVGRQRVAADILGIDRVVRFLLGNQPDTLLLSGFLCLLIF